MTETTLSDDAKAQAIRKYARHTQGTVHWYVHWTGHLRYTDGILHLAETCGAHWLIDLVASWQCEIRRKYPSLAHFQVWRLQAAEQEDDPWVIEVWSDTPEDGASILLARQVIEYSDFPANLALPRSEGYQFWVEGDVALLKEEH